MSNDKIKCNRCTEKLGDSILREENEKPVYNLLITKFFENDLGKQIENHNFCEFCKKDFDLFMKNEILISYAQIFELIRNIIIEYDDKKNPDSLINYNIFQNHESLIENINKLELEYKKEQEKD